MMGGIEKMKTAKNKKQTTNNDLKILGILALAAGIINLLSAIFLLKIAVRSFDDYADYGMIDGYQGVVYFLPLCAVSLILSVAAFVVVAIIRKNKITTIVSIVASIILVATVPVYAVDYSGGLDGVSREQLCSALVCYDAHEE